MGPSVSSTVLIGALIPPGEFEHIQIDFGPVLHADPSVASAFGYISSAVRWLRLYVLAVVSLQLSPLNLFICGSDARWPFVLAVAGLRLRSLELYAGWLMLGTSHCILDSSAQSFLTSSFLLVNISCSVQLLVIKGIGAQFRVWVACRRMSPQCPLIQLASVNIVWAVSSNLWAVCAAMLSTPGMCSFAVSQLIPLVCM